MDWEQNLVNVYNRDLGANDSSNLLIRGFSLQTGSQLWSHVIDDVTQTPKIIASEENWTVLGCDDGSKICALDTVQKSHKILSLPNDAGKVVDLAVRQGKALAFEYYTTAIIWNLVSGEVLYRVDRIFSTCRPVGKIIHFDPTVPQFTLRSEVRGMDHAGSDQVQTMKIKPGNDRFESICERFYLTFDPCISGDLHLFDFLCRIHVGTFGGDRDRRGNRDVVILNNFQKNFLLSNKRFVINPESFGRLWCRSKYFIAPTFVSFETARELCVYDFLNVAQFTKSEEVK